MAYLINLNKYKSVGTNWIALYVNSNHLHKNIFNIVTYFDRLEYDHISKIHF